MTWPTDEAGLRKKAAEFYAEAEEIRAMIPDLDPDKEDIEAYWEDVKFHRELAADTLARIPRKAEPEPDTRLKPVWVNGVLATPGEINHGEWHLARVL